MSIFKGTGIFSGSGGASSFIELSDVPQTYDGNANKFVRVNSTETGLEFIEITNPLQFKGAITVNSDFPTLLDIKEGWFYEIKADVIDNDVTKTNTGLSFIAGNEIAWNGTTWVEIGYNKVRSVNSKTGDVLIDGYLGVIETPSNSGLSLDRTAFGKLVNCNAFSTRYIDLPLATNDDIGKFIDFTGNCLNSVIRTLSPYGMIAYNRASYFTNRYIQYGDTFRLIYMGSNRYRLIELSGNNFSFKKVDVLTSNYTLDRDRYSGTFISAGNPFNDITITGWSIEIQDGDAGNSYSIRPVIIGSTYNPYLKDVYFSANGINKILLPDGTLTQTIKLPKTPVMLIPRYISGSTHIWTIFGIVGAKDVLFNNTGTVFTGTNVQSVLAETSNLLNSKIDKSLGTTKGDIIAFSSSSTPVRVGPTSNNQFLVSNSSKNEGLEWVNIKDSKFGIVVEDILPQYNTNIPMKIEYTGSTHDVDSEASLVTAIINANPLDTIRLTSDITLTSTLNINKSLKITSNNNILQSEGLATDPVTLIDITGDSVYIDSSLIIKHRKTSNTSVELAIRSIGLNFISEATLEFMEFGYLIHGGSFNISGFTTYTGSLGNNHHHIGIYKISENSTVNNVEFDFPSEVTPRSNFIFISSNNSEEKINASLFINNNKQKDLTKVMRQFYFQEVMVGDIVERGISFTFNSFNDLNGGIGFSSDTKDLSFFTYMLLVRNDQYYAGASNYKGLAYLTGSGLTRSIGITNLYYAGNTHPTTVGSDYTSVVDTGGLCFNNTVYTGENFIVKDSLLPNSIYNYIKPVSMASLTELDGGGSEVGGGYTATFTNSDLTSNKITFTHNLNSYVVCQLFDNSNEVIIPDSIVYKTSNSIEIDLTNSVPITGTWTIFITTGSAYNLPTIVSNTYLKANSGGTGYDTKTASQVAADVAANWIDNAPAGTVIGYAYGTISTSVSTTDNVNGASVVSKAYTPKRSDSLIEVSLYARRINIRRDYGSSSVSGDIAGEVMLYEGSTTISRSRINSEGMSNTDGVKTIGVPFSIPPYVAVSGSTTERTYSSKVFPADSNTTAEITAGSDAKCIMIIREIKQ